MNLPPVQHQDHPHKPSSPTYPRATVHLQEIQEDRPKKKQKRTTGQDDNAPPTDQISPSTPIQNGASHATPITRENAYLAALLIPLIPIMKASVILQFASYACRKIIQERIKNCPPEHAPPPLTTPASLFKSTHEIISALGFGLGAAAGALAIGSMLGACLVTEINRIRQTRWSKQSPPINRLDAGLGAMLGACLGSIMFASYGWMKAYQMENNSPC